MSTLKQLLAHKNLRLLVLVVLLVFGIGILLGQLASTLPSELAAFCGNDFTQYYAAGRLLLQRTNPYNPVEMLAIERSIGWTAVDPILMWNPPWAVVLVLPLLAIPFGFAAGIWLVLNTGLLLACGAMMWRIFAPHNDRRYWLGMIVSFVYLPSLQALRIGQISPWLLVGITGFVVAIRARKEGLAGVFLVLFTIKPHVSFLFLFAIAWWIMSARRWRVLLGASAALGVACGVVGLISPAVFGQFLRAATAPPLYWRSATLGTWLRMVFGTEQHWLQYLPSVIALPPFVVWVLHHKGEWDWAHLAPGLLLASAIFAAYGWSFDMVVLLPVVVVLVASLRSLTTRQRVVLMSLYLLSQLGMLLLNKYRINTAYYYWYPLMLAGLYEWQQVKSAKLQLDSAA